MNSHHPRYNTTTSTSWNNLPIDQPWRIEIALHFTERQYLKLKKGLLPWQMEDKWFIFFENDWLYFHRSWTGYGFYKAELKKEPEGYSITEFWAERNQEKYKNENDNFDIETFTFLIARGLLGIDVRKIYVEKNINSETSSAIGWNYLGNLLFSNQGIDYTEKVKSLLFGVAVGDALGVPVEFKSRQHIRNNPVTDMIGYGTYNLPPGTFSDDSSLTFCLAEALTKRFSIKTIGQNFINWLNNNYWTARGSVFDVGIATREAIVRLNNGIKPESAGGMEEKSNGNGSLMRISPLLFYLLDKPVKKRFEIAKKVSSITHGHIRSVIACFYYLEFARQLFQQKDKFEIYKNLQFEVTSHLVSFSVNPREIILFERLLHQNIYELTEDNISGSGYVLHTLEASIWCLLTTNNYKEAVLKAVNLGEDTDTTGAVTGALAGLLYGIDAIPENWLEQIARKDDIEDLAVRLGQAVARY